MLANVVLMLLSLLSLVTLMRCGKIEVKGRVEDLLVKRRSKSVFLGEDKCRGKLEKLGRSLLI